MAFFSRLFSDRLYSAGPGIGSLLLVLPAAGPDTIELPDAWSSTTLLGNFVYSAADPGITADTAATFVAAVTTLVNTSGLSRVFVWLRDADAWKGTLTNTNAPFMGLTPDGTSVQSALDARILSGVALFVAPSSPLTLTDTTVAIGGNISFTGSNNPEGIAPQGTISLAGDNRGTVSFRLYLTRQSLHDNASWGFQLLFATDDPAAGPATYEWLPLAGTDGGGQLGFDSVIDPSDPANQTILRSVLTFTGSNIDGSTTTLASQYRTSFGISLVLTPVKAGGGETNPAALVFTGGTLTSETTEAYQLAPMGDFTISLLNATPATADLLCGLHGTEMITVQPASPTYAGDRLRFTPYQPAFAPRYPFPDVSPVGPPVDVNAPLLTSRFMTSWASVVRAPGGAGAIPYTAQPKGSSLYGQDALLWPENKQLMGWMDPTDAIPGGAVFPLVPYSGVIPGPGGTNVFSGPQISDFERQIVGPTRRRIIGTGGGKASSRHVVLGMAQENGAAYNTTTPTGLLATVNGGPFTRLLLGQNLEAGTKMYFCNLAPELQQAFQTGQLFLVMANKELLGNFAAGSGTCPPSGASFSNAMELSGWRLAANVGVQNRYADYRNVIVVKGRKGKLWDPAAPKDSLVSNPEKWTQKDTFAAPSDLVPNDTPPPPETLLPPNKDELVILSQWMQTYFADAQAQADKEYFATFNAIAQDDNWTGILVLRMDIAEVPDDIAGITAGIKDMTRFNAHHFAMQITNVSNGPPPAGEPPGPWLDKTTSMFGLIHYVDPAFIPPAAGADPQPVAPPPGATYDFQLLSLKVLFRNSAVEKFSSYAQIVATSWFGMPVVRMGAGGNVYSAIVLSGSLQNNSGQPVYSLSSTADTTFYFENDVVNKIEVTNAVMSTRNAGSGAPDAKVVSWFGLAGFIDYKIVQAFGTDALPYAFDLFSFGNNASEDQFRRGLAYSNLGIEMAFPANAPTERLFAFTTGEIRFDIGTSTPRAGSLFQQFALSLQGLTGGSKDTPPSKSGFANVVTDARLTGVDGGEWWGIRYQLNMGTPGNLAGKAGLVSQLVTAWAPQPDGSAGSYKAMLGLQLPGTGGGANLISLQTVLKLSVGQIWLKLDRDKGAFLLLLTEIALKIFGLLSIPPGSTLFYLFGNPKGGGKPSGLGWYAMYRQTKPAALTESGDAVR